MISCVFLKIYDFGKNCGNFYRVLPISRAYFFRGDYLFSRLTNFEGASQLRGPVVYIKSLNHEEATLVRKNFLTKINSDYLPYYGSYLKTKKKKKITYRIMVHILNNK